MHACIHPYLIHHLKEFLGFIERRAIIADRGEERGPLALDLVDFVTYASRVVVLIANHGVGGGRELLDLGLDRADRQLEAGERVAHHTHRTDAAAVVTAS